VARGSSIAEFRGLRIAWPYAFRGGRTSASRAPFVRLARIVIFRLLLILSLATGSLQAGWTLRSRTARPAPAGLAFSESEISRDTDGGATIWAVAFQPRTHAFAVMDNPAGDFDLGSACAKRGALAGVNGGYFQPDRTPLGLVIRQGAQLHPLEKARLLSGIVSVTAGAVTIQRSGAFRLTTAVREALQAGPFLVEGGKKIAGLNDTRAAARTVVFQDGAGRAGVLVCKSTTLAETADILATPALFPEGKILRALNLDGGSSTALWVRGDPPHYQREWKTVRNYLAIVPR
jgi:uncharacterized protein YigE (DUF2233 family)